MVDWGGLRLMRDTHHWISGSGLPLDVSLQQWLFSHPGHQL